MPGSEFQLIQSYFSQSHQDVSPARDVVLGIGDDCAIIAPPANQQLALSIDTLIAGVHFPDNTSADAIAHKALMVNLSDLAAMGARPAWFTLSLTLPDYNDTWLQQFSATLFKLSRQYGISLIGGDTTRGPLSITIQVGGYLEQNRALTRSAARVGDLIALTGPLGAAAIGLDIALQKNHHHYACLSDRQRQQALHALNFPEAKIKEGLLLKDVAHAALDLSDGLASDLGHILEASEVGAELELDKLPLADALSCLEPAQAWEKALTGGDDYELCFTISEAHWPQIKEKLPYCEIVGVITEQKGLRLLTASGQEFTLKTGGYDHFG